MEAAFDAPLPLSDRNLREQNTIVKKSVSLPFVLPSHVTHVAARRLGWWPWPWVQRFSKAFSVCSRKHRSPLSVSGSGFRKACWIFLFFVCVPRPQRGISVWMKYCQCSNGSRILQVLRRRSTTGAPAEAEAKKIQTSVVNRTTLASANTRASIGTGATNQIYQVIIINRTDIQYNYLTNFLKNKQEIENFIHFKDLLYLKLKFL